MNGIKVSARYSYLIYVEWLGFKLFKHLSSIALYLSYSLDDKLLIPNYLRYRALIEKVQNLDDS